MTGKPAGARPSRDEAIRELTQPTGDPERDEVQLALAESLRRGYLEITGRARDGVLKVQLTPAGRQYVEQTGKR